MRPAAPGWGPIRRRTRRRTWCLAAALVSISKFASAGCPAGTIETGQYRTETENAIIVHHVCTPLAQLSPDEIVTYGLEDLAAQLGWSAAKRASLAAALDRLPLTPRYRDAAGYPVSWRRIVARSNDAQLAREAAAGFGPNLWSAGSQTHYPDCVLFALAVAAERPYGVVAALATDLIGQETWRPIPPSSPPLSPQDAVEKSGPQNVVEQLGLNGGEMIYIAQSLGEVKVVTPDEFDRTLQAGQPIMADVNTSGNPDARSLHEVVVTKEFTHDGAPWFELVDSVRQGALRPLYLSEPELHSILVENGVVYTPDRGRTPALLR